MAKRTFEDFHPGMEMIFGPRLVTRDEIVAFAAEFDPQPMHMDEDAGRRSMLRGLAGSGWHTCCLLMRMLADGLLAQSSSMGAPGVEAINWLAPLRPDSSITVHMRVLETRVSRSRPGMGLVRLHFDVLDDTDTLIMTLVCTLMFGTRVAAGSAAS
ncbi:MAG TPA: MaoC family dehydratase [Pseudolabrys sp.]|nr:MaoC family dehydratase [Pseudolabrys sp.]